MSIGCRFCEDTLGGRLTHFFHVFADGNFSTPIREHFTEARVSGLLGVLDSVRVGVVGDRVNRERVLGLFAELDVPVSVVAEADTGWEQVTLKELHQFAKQDDGKIFYAHTKGAWSPDPIAQPWRTTMIHDTVTRWRECVNALESVQVAGAYWLRSDMPEHHDHKFFFAGNFWWARSDYVGTLDPVGEVSRYQAEGWLGLGEPSVQNMREGLSTWGNFWEPS
jgi:hypothetical protein